jgi:hypothetical protein
MKVGMVAGEASGDQLGAALIAELRRRLPDVQCVGVGGPKMRAQGLEACRICPVCCACVATSFSASRRCGPTCSSASTTRNSISGWRAG